MKKYLSFVLFLMLFLLSTTMVFADEHINYEWGDYFNFKNDDYYWKIYDVIEQDDGYLIYGNEAVRLYDKNGKVLKESYVDGFYCHSGVYYDEDNNQFLCLFLEHKYMQGKYVYVYEYRILDVDYKEIRSRSVIFDDAGYYDVINNTSDYYILIDFDYYTMTLLKKDLSDIKTFEYDELSDEDLKKYLGEYYDIVKLNISNEDSNKYYYSLKSNDNYKILISYNYTTKKYVVEVYDKDDTFLFRRYVNSSNQLFVELGNDGYYVLVEEDIDDRSECYYKDYRETCSSQLVLYKYDYSNNKIYEENLSKLTSARYDYKYGEGNRVSTLKIMDGKLFILINYYSAPSSLDEEKTGEQPAVLVYSFIYDIEYKTDGNGEVKAVESSKAGEEVTFKVTPNKGYVLENVKVTDSNGNVVVFTDNTFTMPSSDVIIEASFVPDNPDTADVFIIGLIVLFGIGIVWFSRSKKKVRWLSS